MKGVTRLAIGLALLTFAEGCGSGETLGVGVSGTISYKGQPVKEGVISFVPIGGHERAERGRKHR